MKQKKFLTSLLILALAIVALYPWLGQAQAQTNEPYVPSGILISELGDKVPPGQLNVRFPPRDPAQVGEEIRHLLKQPDSTPGEPVLAQQVPPITAEIQTLATGLENDPLAIYDYVYNHIDYIPSWGLLKNPRETLLAGAGNAFDQAALLAALLNAAGFETRYVWGNIRVSKTAAMNWVGATDPDVMGYVFANGGIPTTDEGSTLLLTHIWIQVSDGGTWHSLDPSFKTYSEQAGQDLRALMEYDLPTFISRAESGAIITPDYVQNLNQTNIRDDLADYALNLVNYLRSGETFVYPEDLIGGRQIMPIESTSYPAALPYEVVTTLGQATDIPDDFAYELTIQLPGINYTVNVNDIAGERITIFYECATPADCQQLEDGGGVYNVYPAYQVDVVPKLRIGGTVVATGDAVPLGSWGHQLDVTIATPIDGWSPSFSQVLIAGEWYALPMRLQTVSNRALARHVDLLNEAMALGLDPDDERVLGQVIYLLGLSYFNQVDQGDRVDSRLAEIVHIPHFSMMIASRNLTVWIDALWRPVMLDAASHTVDVRLDVASAVSAETPASADRERAWFLCAGMRGSAVEHAIVEQLRSVSAISTVQILNRAIEQGQRTYYITPTNKDAVIPLLGHSDGVKDSIDADVDGGWHVVISEDPITYGEWHGSGWIVLDPDSGSAGYLISGGLGSTTSQAPLIIRGGSGVEPESHLETRRGQEESNEAVAYLQATQGQDREPLGRARGRVVSDPIDAATGAFVYHHQDLASLGGLGVPLGFERFYASSQNSLTGPLGYGWSHSYNTRFYTSTDWARILGGRTALEAAPALAASQVGVDLFDFDAAMIIPHQRYPMDVTVAHWLMAQITGNAATLIEPDGTVDAHVRLIDGTYQPPVGGVNLDAVTIGGSGSATLDWEDGTRMYFNVDGLPTALDDANGNRLSLSYDGQGRLSQVSDTVGRTLTFSYNAQGLLSQITDPAGRTLNYGYDSQRNLQTCTNVRGGVTTYAYDADHRVTQVTDPLGTTYVTNQHDVLGRVTTQDNGRGGQTSFLYGGDHTVITDPMGYRNTFFFDERNRLLGVRDALDICTFIAYDAADHETSQTDGLGHTTTFAYDAQGHLTTITDPLGNAITWTYDAASNPISYTDQRDKTWQFAYDGQHNLNSVTDPLDGVTHYTYNSKGQLTQAQDPAGVSVGYSYDSYGNLTCLTNALGEASCWNYDILGRPIGFTDSTGHTTQFSYDYDAASNLLVRVTDPLGHQTTYVYDVNGNLTKITDAKGHVTTFTYDTQFNLTGVSDALGGNTTYDYDANDGLIRITDANGHQTSYQHDPVGRVVAITDPLGHTVTFIYDDADRLTTFGRADGSSIGYQHDALGRLIGIDYPTGSDINYTYDAAGNLTHAAYGDDWSASYGYDDAGRLSAVEDNGRNLILSYTYDPAGRRTGLRVNRDAAVLYDLHYDYDTAGRLSALTDQTGSPVATIGFSYDAASRLIQITDPSGARADYVYDAAGRLAAVSHRDNRGANVATYDHTYDANGNPTAISETTPIGSFVTDYTYDALDRLTTESYPRYTIEYTYDPVGNLIQRIDPLGTVDYAYDAADQLQSQGGESFDYDQNGNLITWQNARGTYAFAYNDENLLTSLTLPDDTVLSFAYDAFNRRLTAQGPTGSRGFLHDGLNILLIGNSDLSGAVERYLYGNGLLVANHTDHLGFTAYHSDAVENVRYLMDGSGRAFEAYRYDAFGHPARQAGIASNPFRFVGQRSVYQHGVLGWPALMMGYRYYDPGSGRFLTRDPWPGTLFNPISLNSYNYAFSNPTRYNDPSGLRPLPSKPSITRLTADMSPAPSPSSQRPALPSVPASLLPPGLASQGPNLPMSSGGQEANQPPGGLSGRRGGAAVPGGSAAPRRPLPGASRQRAGAPAPALSLGINQPPFGPYKLGLVPPWHGLGWRNWLDRLLYWLEWLNWWRWWGLTQFPQGGHSSQSGLTSLDMDGSSVSWRSVADHGSTYALVCTANDRLLAGAFLAGLFRSTDTEHAAWNAVHVASVGEIAVADTDTHYAGTWYGGALKSSDGGASWSPLNNDLAANDVYALVADPTAPNHLFAGTEMGLFVSDSGGTSWGRPAGNLPGRLVSELAFAGDVLLAVTDLGLYRSENDGGTWQTTTDLPPVPIYVLLVASPDSTVYAGTAMGLYKSTDAGGTWTSWGTGMDDTDVHALAVDPADANHMVAGTTAGLFVSTNGGVNWVADSYGGLDGIASQVGALTFCPDGGDVNLYLGAGGGVYALREARPVYLPIIMKQQ
jgi:RHS repeat-associated protein